MSFLSWFGKKQANRELVPEPSSDLGQADATVPTNRFLPPDRSPDVGSRRNDRGERRELLYGVVRECMTAAGVLSATYKFKVLSLDSSGRKYLIMVDMPHEHMSGAAHFAEIEGVIARSAKDRYDILVTAVYWRVNELVSATTASPHTNAQTRVQTTSPRASGAPESVPQPTPRYAELQAEEVMAFKRAVAAAANGAVARGETRKSTRRNQEQMPDFSNTEPFEAPPPLGTTQFGGLG
jgi:hypothetical protein